MLCILNITGNILYVCHVPEHSMSHASHTKSASTGNSEAAFTIQLILNVVLILCVTRYVWNFILCFMGDPLLGVYDKEVQGRICVPNT
jgi:hypothetical protein